MPYCAPQTGGWRPDLSDHRDYTRRHPLVEEHLGRLEALRGKEARPARVDWREYCGPVEDQGPLAASPAHACAGMVQYFERRATGRLLRPSRLFLHAAARRTGTCGERTVSLRDTLKALVRFGLPPETLWPYSPELEDDTPSPFTLAFQHEYRDLRYLRLDEPNAPGEEALDGLRSFLAAGFCCVLGIPLSDTVGREAEIPFPTLSDSVRTGHAVLAVGYDNGLRIRSDKGALLIRNSWGGEWGDAGYGWLPYSYLREGLAVDVWTALKPEWLASGEFHRPA